MSNYFKTHSSDKTTFKTVGMCGSHCVAKVETGLRSLEGVISAAADFEKNEVDILYDPQKVTIEDLKKTVLNVGYTVL
jgi:copper chaperone